MSNETYVKPGRAARVVTSPAEKVKAVFEGFKPAKSEPDEAPVATSGNTPEFDNSGSPLSDSDATDYDDAFGPSSGA